MQIAASVRQWENWGKGSYLVLLEPLMKPQINVCGKRILSSKNLSTLAFSGLIWLHIDLLTLPVLKKVKVYMALGKIWKKQK